MRRSPKSKTRSRTRLRQSFRKRNKMSMLIDVTEIRPPTLEFGRQEVFTDPRIGLLRSGPFSLRFNRAHKSQLRLGIIGPPEMLKSAREWYDRCQSKMLTGKIDNPMYIDFPGF